MQVFAFDDQAFAQTSNLHLAPGPVEKLGVALEADRPSDLDAVSSFAGSVMPLDDGGWRMYYSCVRGREFGIAIAESDDGLHWTKPCLGQMQWEGEQEFPHGPQPGGLANCMSNWLGLRGSGGNLAPVCDANSSR